MVFAVAMAALLGPAVAVPAVANAGPPGDEPQVDVVATGLRGAIGSAIGPDGALYVTEAAVGEVTRIDPRSGGTSTYARGLPPALVGVGTGGAIDVAFLDHTAYVLVSVVGPDAGGTAIDGIYRVDDADTVTLVADLGEWSRLNPPPTDFSLERGVQFAFEAARGGFVVTDGHHNRVLYVTPDGAVTQVIQFDNIVPTGLTVRGGTVYLAQAGPIPHDPATGKVVSFRLRNPEPREIASGYSLMIDVEFGKCGLYALSQGDSPGVVPAGSPALADSGELLRVTSDGALEVVVDELDRPTSVEFAGNAAWIVTLGGDVLRVTDFASGRGHDCRGGHHR